VLKDLEYNEKDYRPQKIHGMISAAKNELYLPQDMPIFDKVDEVAREVYEAYQKILLSSNALDFDDLLLWMAFLLRDNEKVREKYARRFEHILVDEFQDTNMAQYTLLKYLASYHRNIFVVGDSDQSIYRWRGADYRNVRRFEEDFPDTEVILLEQNYRSTQNILNTAMAIIDRNTYRTHLNLFTERGEGELITIREAFDEYQQASFVVDIIKSQIREAKADVSDFAIMYRTNAQSRIIEEAFLSANIPYRLVGAQRFYGRREVKDIIAYLRVIINPDDIVSLRRIINVPRRKIGVKTFADLLRNATLDGVTPGAYLINLTEDKSSGLEVFNKSVAARLLGFAKMLVKWRKQVDSLPPVEMIDQILEDTDYRIYIEDGTDDGYDRWENVEELRRLASEYQTVGLYKFLENIALISDQDTLDVDAEGATLLTLHSAKGLEFKQVLIIGLNDEILPHIRSMGDQEAMEEERRLFYVGITRAKDRLYLLHSLIRNFGHSRDLEPSPFYVDIPPELRAEDTQFGIQLPSQDYRIQIGRTWNDLQSESARKQPLEKQFNPGDKVQHPKWGSGLVLSSRLQDDDEIVDVFFEGLDDKDRNKKLIASLSNLKKIA
jgi:DNA helicase-2/ATP-dependent DNA helicase PcrA